jgi:hypothetical protein
MVPGGWWCGGGGVEGKDQRPPGAGCSLHSCTTGSHSSPLEGTALILRS